MSKYKNYSAFKVLYEHELIHEIKEGWEIIESFVLDQDWCDGYSTNEGYIKVPVRSQVIKFLVGRKALAEELYKE